MLWRALTLLVLGFSLATSVLLLRYRDLNQVWDVITQAGFFRGADHLSARHCARIVPLLLLSVAADADYRIFARRAHIAHRAERHGISIWGSKSRSHLCDSLAHHASVGPRAAEMRLKAEPMIVLEARDVSKSFWIPDEHRDTIREHVLAAFRKRPLRELRVLRVGVAHAVEG